MLAEAKWATLSDEEPTPLYRYELGRIWDALLPTMVWIMLNPSTADADLNDPTILACMEFARNNGCGSIVVVNLFAFRSPHPKVMVAADDPVGPLNAARLISVFASAYQHEAPVIAAWGTNGGYLGRDAQVKALAESMGVDLQCFGVTKDGHPKHPLARGLHRIPRDTKPFPLRNAA
jgi:hypothetical protein